MGTMSRYSLHGLSRKGEGPTGCSYPRLSPSGIWRLNIPALFCVPLPFCPYSCFSFHIIFSSQHQPPPLCLCLSWFVMFLAASTSCLLFLHPLMSASLIFPHHALHVSSSSQWLVIGIDSYNEAATYWISDSGRGKQTRKCFDVGGGDVSILWPDLRKADFMEQRGVFASFKFTQAYHSCLLSRPSHTTVVLAPTTVSWRNLNGKSCVNLGISCQRISNYVWRGSRDHYSDFNTLRPWRNHNRRRRCVSLLDIIGQWMKNSGAWLWQMFTLEPPTKPILWMLLVQDVAHTQIWSFH